MFWIGVVFLLTSGGCEAEKPTDPAPEKAEASEVEITEKTGADANGMDSQKRSETEVNSRRAALTKEDVSGKLRAAREAAGKPGDVIGAKRTRNRRVPPPKGMSAHPDFVGARVGLIHTANVMGEVDPCG